MKIYPLIDPLKGILILGIVAYHCGGLGLGWIGVPIFFVISGFLLTQTLLCGKRKVSPLEVSKTFYKNRALRILPPYLLLGAVLLLSAWVFGTPQSMKDRWLSFFSFSYNFLYPSPDFTKDEIYSHIWFLCVQVQYYLVWPVIILGLPERNLRRVLWLMVLAAPLVRWELFQWLMGMRPDRVWAAKTLYVLPTTYMDAYALSALLALKERLLVRWKPVVAAGTALAGFVALGLWRLKSLANQGIHLPPDTIGYPIALPNNVAYVWGYSLIALVAVFVLRALTEWKPGNGKFKYLGPLGFLGSLSLGIYLFHKPLVFLISPWIADWPFHKTWVYLCTLLLSSSLAVLSYNLIEKKLQAFKGKTMDSPSTGSMRPEASRLDDCR